MMKEGGSHPKTVHRGPLLSFLFALELLLFILSVRSIADFKPYSTAKRYIYKDTVIRTKPKLHNPFPPNSSNYLYIAVIDSAFRESPAQCNLKAKLLENFALKPDLEFYSTVDWTNADCNVTSITVPPPKYPGIDSSTWIVHKLLSMFLDRSEAKNLFVVSDTAFIRFDKFQAFLKSSPQIQVAGSCIQFRYFFNMLDLRSGIIFSRAAAKRLLDSSFEETWEVSEQTEISADEALSQVLDQAGFYARSLDAEGFVGRPFYRQSDYERLLQKNFSSMPKCILPHEFIDPPPGEGGVCSTSFTRVNNIIVWAGAPEGKERWFLSNAESMLNHIPDDIYYMWHQTYPELCKL